MGDDRNIITVLNVGGDRYGPRAFPHYPFFDCSVGAFNKHHLISVSGNIDIFWVKINQTVDRPIDGSSSTPLERGEKFKRENGLVAVIDNIDHVHVGILK